MSDPFIQQLAHLCRQHTTRAKWVFVPSHAIGRVVGERLALSGTNWLNLHFVTPLDIALRMGAPFLVERGIDPSEEGLGPALIMRLLLALPEEGGYFRPLADQPTMAQALWSTIRELRMAGVEAGDLPAEAFESPAKHAELRELLAAYEHFLAANSRGDMATVYEEAVAHPDWCPIQAADCWTELPDVIWTPLQHRLLDIMPGERITPRALALPGGTVPRRLVQCLVCRARCARRREQSPGLSAEPARRAARRTAGQGIAQLVCGRRQRRRNRRSLPPHPRRRRVARPGRGGLLILRSRDADVGKGAAPRLASHARPGHPGGVHTARTRAGRAVRLDRNRLLGAAPASPAPVRRSGPRKRG